MADIFTPVIERLQSIGAFKFLFPYMLSTSIFYGLLRKSEVFGKPDVNVGVNATVALVASFMVWGYPILTGVDIETQLATFFTHGIIITLVFMMSLMIIGMFFPDNLTKHLSEGILKGNKQGAMLIIGIFFGFIILVTSGLYDIFLGPLIGGSGVGISSDIFLSIGVIILLVIPFMFIMWGDRKSKSGNEGNK